MSEITTMPIRRELFARGISDSTFGKLKTSLEMVKRERTWKSKYRHKSKFAHKGSIAHWPIWAKVLIALAIVLVVLFIGGLVFYGKKEYDRSRQTGRSIRWGKIFLGATKIALFLWIPIVAYRFIQARRNKGKYADITKESQQLPNNGGTTKPWSMAQAPGDVDSKYEPMGYKTTICDPYSAYAGVEQPMTGRVAVTGPLSRATSPAVPALGIHQPPPVHESGDLGTRTPSPNRGSFPPSPQPPQYG
ncbi:uncharacterized protein F5Z01DRAFT_643844 [Emericellopsis atlantica]|uniref:Uncharacterized protein n=1 Tax=Emericellopsis atlantica TaxID=2614577 RepID=A0A9P8CTS1_9HYPO|nr:uncharacterized protein F5Z01DRAFT_643844 [Emericellopsis atlantica]KAG9258657.1 hypothetical protein F5Z01DRAFT_643844 [Emericellopsis atlantica]